MEYLKVDPDLLFYINILMYAHRDNPEYYVDNIMLLPAYVDNDFLRLKDGYLGGSFFDEN